VINSGQIVDPKPSSKTDLVGLRFIAVYRFTKAIILTFLWYSFIKGVDYHAESSVISLAHQLRINPDNKIFQWMIIKLSGLETSTIQTAGYGILVYAGFLYVESIGLWFNYFWAKYLVIIGTGILIPWEIRLVYKHPNLTAWFLLIGNIMIVAFVVRVIRKQKAFK